MPTLIPSRSPARRISRAALALLTSSSLVFQTLAPALAQTLVIDPAAANQGTVGQAPNGVPLIEIARPNGNGLSQNVFSDFNVGAQGLVFNNSTQLGQSVLGGVVLANPNLAGTTPASVILNEVSSTNPSALNGTMEVFGGRAAIVVANPNGITCDGCGFINASRGTLTTGVPLFGDERLTGFSVDRGTVQIGAGGLDARGTDYFDIVSRAAVLNGAIHGNDVAVFAGRNDFDYAARQVTAVRAPDGSTAPTIAIDSSALGGMYANKITLVSTEAGVGVNAPAGLVAGLGGMTLSADGRLAVGSGAAQGRIAITSASGDVALGGTLHSGDTLSVLAGGGIALDEAVLGALGDITLAGQSIDLAGSAVLAGINGGGVLQHGLGAVTFDAAGSFGADADSTIVSGAGIDIGADTITLNGQIVSGGLLGIAAGSSLTANAGQTIDARGGIGLAAGGTMLLDGIIQSDEGITLDAATLTSTADLSADTLSFTTGGLLTLGGTSLAATLLDIQSGGNVVLNGTTRSEGVVTVAGQQIKIAPDATLTSGGALGVTAQGGLNIGADALVAAGLDLTGALGSTGALTLSGATVDVAGADLAAAQALAIQSSGGVTLSGNLGAGGLVEITANGNVTTGADILSQTGVVISGQAITNSGTLETLGALSLLGTNSVGQSGTLRANGDILLQTGGAITQSGTIEGAQTVTLDAGAAITNTASGLVVSNADLRIYAASLSNAGAIGAGRDLLIEATGNVTNADLFAAKRHIDIALNGTLTNTGTVFAANALSIAGLNAARAASVINENGLIEANEGNLSIAANQLINRSTGITFATDYSTNTVTQAVGGTCIQNWGAFGNDLVCEETRTSTQTQVWTERLEGSINAARILAGGDLAVSGGTITNEYALIAALGNIDLTGTSLTNIARDLIESETITVRVARDILYCSVWLILCGRHDVETVNDAPVANSSSQTIGSVHATIQAGGTLTGSFTGQIDNTTIRENAGQVGLSSGIGVAGPTAATVDLSLGASGTPLVPGAPGVDLSALLSGGSLTQVSPDPLSHYLIETRPEFIDISRFFNSDYFFARMPDYQPDQWLRRLGDAYVETRLIQDQIFALTGRRLLEGFGADLDQIRALYDNALATAQALNLSTGIALTAEQVAALTDDIIWQEWVEVDGQMVLVPRVYLAANSRNGQGGAQITGGNVLLASANLTNSGVIDSDGLTGLLVAGGLENIGGRIAGNTVALDVGGILANLSGAIAGQTVSITAGSLINQTLVTRDETDWGYADRAQQQATISGTGNVTLTVEDDVFVIGGAISAGDNLAISAGGDISVIASQRESASSTTFASGEASSYSLVNDLATLEAGGNLSVSAGENLSLIGAAVTAGGDALLQAEGDVTIASVQDVTQREMDASITGSGIFGTGLLGTQTDLTESEYSATTLRGTISAGGDVSIVSEEGDITLQAALVDAGGVIALSAEEGRVSLLTGIDSRFSQETEDWESLLWWTASDEGEYVEEVIHTLLSSGEGLTITTRDGIVVEYQETGTFDGSIDQLSQIEGLSWMAELRERDDVNWQAVSAAQESWNYSDQGLTETGAALVALAVSAAISWTGIGSSFVGLFGVGENVVLSAALEAGFTSLAQQASIALINNQGDIAAALADLGSQASILSLVSSMLTAGLTAGALDIAGIPGVSPDLSFSENLINGLQTNLIKATIKVGVSTIVEGAPLDQTLLSALRLAVADTIGAAVATEIGTAAKTGGISSAAQLIAHAALGCATGVIAGGDCVGGAAGGVAGELVAQAMLANWTEAALQGLLDGSVTFDQVGSDLAQLQGGGVNVAALAGGIAAALAGGDVDIGAMTGGTAAEYNALQIPAVIILEELLKALIIATAVQATVETVAAINDGSGDDPSSTWPSNGGPPLDDDEPNNNPNPNDPNDTTVALILTGIGWTATQSFTSEQNALDHWRRHGSEFPEFSNAQEYVQAVQNFVTNPPQGTLTKNRPNGDILFYNPATNTFAIRSGSGAPRTMFRPSAGLEYWLRQ